MLSSVKFARTAISIFVMIDRFIELFMRVALDDRQNIFQSRRGCAVHQPLSIKKLVPIIDEPLTLIHLKRQASPMSFTALDETLHRKAASESL
jgi:hypothetical protein